MRQISRALLIVSLLSQPLGATEQPLSAIDWLDQPIVQPIAPPPRATLKEPAVTDTATVPGVAVSPLGAATPDSVGLLPTATTGLPRSLWHASREADLIRALDAVTPETLPAVQALVYTLLLAEADPPANSGDNAEFLRARVRTLVRFGAVDPARALLERAGPAHADLFDLWLNLTLLSGDEDKPCAILQGDPALSQDYAARIYCTARAGDWMTAALTYETAAALGTLQEPLAGLLAQYLDPETIHDSPGQVPPAAPSPLVFRLYESVGSPLPTRNLPRAFAMADLRGLSGWKAELEAAERLGRTGALPATRLFGLYTDRSPAASGGIWDRVRAVQALDRALFSRDPERVAQTLPAAWAAMKDHGLAIPFAQFFAPALMQVDVPPDLRPMALRVALLSPEYEAAAAKYQAPGQPEDQMLMAIARGTATQSGPQGTWTAGILQGLDGTGPSARHAALLQDGKLGEAILQAATELGQAGQGTVQDASEGLKTLRAVGLEDTARRAALQLLILGPAR